MVYFINHILGQNLNSHPMLWSNSIFGMLNIGSSCYVVICIITVITSHISQMNIQRNDKILYSSR